MDRGGYGNLGRSGRDVRCSGQADPRIQAAASQYPRDDRALAGDAGQSERRLDATRQDLRRQGRAGLFLCQGDHPSDQLGGACGQ